jgi:hypothetical protein
MKALGAFLGSGFAVHSSRALRASQAAWAGCLLLTGACAHSMALTPQEPSATSQLLLVRSLDRAVAQLDLSPLGGRRVDVELVGQAGNLAFAKEVIEERLRERGVHLSSDAPELKLVVLATVLGTDRGETLVGSPAMQAPIVSLPAPEIALFKWIRHRGLVELEVAALDPQSGELMAKLGPEIGHAKHDDFTILIAINFSVSDIDEQHAGGDDTHERPGRRPEDAMPKGLAEGMPLRQNPIDAPASPE